MQAGAMVAVRAVVRAAVRAVARGAVTAEVRLPRMCQHRLHA